MIAIASEDIGNADPRALQLAHRTRPRPYERLGRPNASWRWRRPRLPGRRRRSPTPSYLAWKQAQGRSSSATARVPVPIHLRNAPTKLMKQMGYGAGVSLRARRGGRLRRRREHWFPDASAPQRYYHPLPRGMEIEIGEKLRRSLRATDTRPPRERSCRASGRCPCIADVVVRFLAGKSVRFDGGALLESRQRAGVGRASVIGVPSGAPVAGFLQRLHVSHAGIARGGWPPASRC